MVLRVFQGSDREGGTQHHAIIIHRMGYGRGVKWKGKNWIVAAATAAGIVTLWRFGFP